MERYPAGLRRGWPISAAAKRFAGWSPSVTCSSALIYRGPGVVRDITAGLAQVLVGVEGSPIEVPTQRFNRHW